MISRSVFELVKEKYGYWASWAIWQEEGTSPKSNVGDLSIFDDPHVCEKLTAEVIFVGLNISRGAIKEPLANFHDKRTEATDFKIRYAFKETPFWGGYMTDIIKDFDQKESGKVAKFLKENKQFEDHNVQIFKEELVDIGAINPILIAFGRDTYGILKKNFSQRFQILKVPHYANYSSKENYRVEVTEAMKLSNQQGLVSLE